MKPNDKTAFDYPRWGVVLLCSLFLLAGVTGHAPWKTDDAINLGVVHGMLGGDGWLIPRIAGDAWAGSPPLWHWIAASCARLTQWFLSPTDGARLASPLFAALALFCLARAGNDYYSKGSGNALPAVTLGTLGLLVPIHEANPTAAVIAAGAAAYYGLALMPRRPMVGAICLGAGCGGAFLADGLSGVLPLLPLALLPALHRRWIPLFFGLYTALTVASLWPTLLALRAPDFLTFWWEEELRSAVSSRNAFSLGHLKLLIWYAWPVLPLAGWTLWTQRRDLLAWNIVGPLLGLLCALLWFVTHEARNAHAVGLIVPLTLLAVAGLPRLRRGAANAFDWFGAMTLSLFIALIWLGAIALWTGWPPKIARNLLRLTPGFEPNVALLPLLAGLVLTAAWTWALFRLPRSSWRAGMRWTGGLCVLWCLLVALWMPWIDYGMSYRPAALALRRALPATADCVMRRDLGLAQRASIDIHAGIRTRPETSSATCHWLLAQEVASRKPAHTEGWTRVWEGRRPGDKSERLRLYRRD